MFGPAPVDAESPQGIADGFIADEGLRDALRVRHSRDAYERPVRGFLPVLAGRLMQQFAQLRQAQRRENQPTGFRAMRLLLQTSHAAGIEVADRIAHGLHTNAHGASNLRRFLSRRTGQDNLTAAHRKGIPAAPPSLHCLLFGSRQRADKERGFHSFIFAGLHSLHNLISGYALGKAMTSLKEGKGLVLVLVTLQ